MAANVRQYWTHQEIVMPFLVAVVNPAQWNKYDIEQAVHIRNILWSCKQDQSIHHYITGGTKTNVKMQHSTEIDKCCSLLTGTQEVAKSPKSKNTKQVCDLHI